MTGDLRALILEALNTAPAAVIRDDPEEAARYSVRPYARHDKHQCHAFCALCSGEADTLADAVMAVLDKAFPPALAVFAEPAAQTPELAELRDRFAAAYEAQKAQPLRIMPPNAVAIRRRTPEERRRYLVEHRDEALANGIPAELIDMMIADAEAET